MESRRVSVAKEGLSNTNYKEDIAISKSIEQEIRRQKMKTDARLRIEESQSYRSLRTIATVMDKYFIDPILGLFPGIGDALSSCLSFPFIYVSLFKIGSIPLTLAVIYNILKDTLLGMIPFWIGDIIDVFNRSYLQNLRLIVGFVEDDQEIIKEVNRKAIKSFIGIAILCFLIYLMIKIVASIISWFSELFS
ncbi:DUF4112 domain-containing protein [Myroides fluvii]|uniref:DUF4112 domain-containing protein n=1 Tax=Myroides fluvii TaxID=2572594 RepID=UPI00131AFD73|nr:DUF4112 domain-containing protein [Myroides fluvii]